MNLMKFKGADDAVKLTIRLSAGYCIILTIAFASSIIVLFFIVVVYETCPDRGGTAYVGQLAACR